MYYLIDYVQSNAKDFANILFWIFTGCLAFMTYVNAKKTLFNPIRSEMVKYQMKIITEFIDNHTGKGLNLDLSIDYLSMTKINYDINYLLDIYKSEESFENHIFDDLDKEVIRYCEENIAGLFEVIKDKDLYSFGSTVIGDYQTIKQYAQRIFVKSKEATNKGLPLQKLYFTKKFYNLYSDLINLQTNPFIPREVKTSVDTILLNITKNLCLLYESLSIYIPEEKAKFYREIYYHFEQKKIDHKKDLEILRETITKYFKVNKI
ncbi:hypothetical protein [Flavobacterium notoginsengisoli]|uniref:hypothetical protein n=1 Tax=Flavobacterium notoginsengisoli TaxID=1478199 RepID=UPI00363C136C